MVSICHQEISSFTSKGTVIYLRPNFWSEGNLMISSPCSSVIASCGVACHVEITWSCHLVLFTNYSVNALRGSISLLNSEAYLHQMLFVICQKIKQLNYAWGLEKRNRHEGVSSQCCQFSGQIWWILKKLQKLHKMCFWAILVTFIFDLKIDLIDFESHHINILHEVR